MGKVLIVCGSKSDLDIANVTKDMLDQFGIDCSLNISSAHRMAEKTSELIKRAEGDGFSIIITLAGYSAHLGGVAASWTTLPVITVPISSSPLKGIDSIFSTIQMPSGIPVATMSLDKAGAKNAAIFAIEILSIYDKNLKQKLLEYRKKLSQG